VWPGQVPERADWEHRASSLSRSTALAQPLWGWLVGGYFWVFTYLDKHFSFILFSEDHLGKIVLCALTIPKSVFCSPLYRVHQKKKKKAPLTGRSMKHVLLKPKRGYENNTHTHPFSSTREQSMS
jgi:hypothetical protein